MAVGLSSRVGPYEVTALIGEGGMGKVWRAHHTALKRDDALKVLPDAFASDPERLARFQREAQVLASLNHPNIAHVHGLEQADGVQALVMELVEGPTLADRIAQGPISVDEALPIARQIAEALEAAHERGIIHRDLKPANIKVRPDGTVKVLDFGLAKSLEPLLDVRTDATISPTITSPAMMTGVGVILGTAAYMSPEQAKGRAADKRSDIWAFGCVLFEMLTGRRVFDVGDVSETLAAVLMKAPEWAALPPATPPPVAEVLRRCLQKDRKRRMRDIGDVSLALEGPFDIGVSETAAVARVQPAAWRRVLTLGAVAIAGAVFVAGTVWFAMRPPAPRVARLTITTPPAAALSINGVDRDLAITSDGSRVVYVGGNGSQLFARTLDDLEPMPIFEGGPRSPSVSPDGQWVAFIDFNTQLKKVAVTGGPAVTLAPVDPSGPRGVTWLSDDTIIFATNLPTIGLQRVSAAGGMPTVLTRPDPAAGEVDHIWPETLPGGRAVLFTITSLAGGIEAAQVAVLDLETGTRKVVIRGGSHAHYVPSGHLMYAAEGTLRAVAFDLGRLETRGASVPVVPDVVTTTFGGVDAVVSADGVLAYVPSGGATGAQRTLVWVDRQGQETSIPLPPRAYQYPRLAPDGTRAALFLQDQELDLWLWDFGRSTLTRVTFDPRLDAQQAWTPDGRRLILSSERGGARNLSWQASDGRGGVERLSESDNVQNVSSVSPDGARLIFSEATPNTNFDIMELQLDESRRVRPLVQTPFTEQNGIVSPDGRWLAYEANESGRFEVYVRPFPDVNGGRWQVSTGGGTRPLWSRNGQELFYVSSAGGLMRVGVERGPVWAATAPSLLLKEGYYTTSGGNPGRTYDISPDGKRFLMIKPGGGSDATVPSSVVVVIRDVVGALRGDVLRDCGLKSGHRHGGPAVFDQSVGTRRLSSSSQLSREGSGCSSAHRLRNNGRS